VKGSPDITENSDAHSRKPTGPLTSAESAPKAAEGQVERESIVEYIEK